MNPVRHSKETEIVARALAASNVGTWEWRIAEDVVRCDSIAAAMLGIPMAQTRVGATYGLFVDRLHPQDRSRIRSLIDDLCRRGGLYVARYRTVPEPGKERWVMARGLFAADPDGIVHEARGIVIDVTEGGHEGAVAKAASRVAVAAAAEGGIDGVAELALALRGAAEKLPPHQFERLRPLMDTVLHEIGRQLAGPAAPSVMSLH